MEASQSLKSILKKWDHFPASTVMSPAAVCPAQECTWATYRANIETRSHTHRHDTRCCSEVATVEDSKLSLESTVGCQTWRTWGHDMVTVLGLAELKVERLF